MPGSWEPHTVSIMPDPRARPETALNAVRLLPVVLVLAILAAHFYRAGAMGSASGVTVALLPLLFARASWAARVLQAALVLGALEWLRTAAALIAVRQSMGQPYTRLAIILGAVALATALCALLFQWRPVARALRAWAREGTPAPSRAARTRRTRLRPPCLAS